MLAQLNPEEIRPLHSVRGPRKFVELANDMEENGWNGRPLLVIQSGNSYQAWTGSHRIAAAIAVSMETVPCYIVDESLLPEGITATFGHVEDSDRLAAIRATGDREAIHIMWAEGRS